MNTINKFGEFFRAQVKMARAFFTSSLLYFFPLLATTEAALNLPTGTYIVKGTVKDEVNQVVSVERGVKIRAVNARGTVLAESDVGALSASGANFALTVPLSTAATDATAAVGDELNAVFINEKGVSVATQPIRVRAANAIDDVNFSFLDMTTVTSEDGSKSVRIPTKYLDEIQAYLDIEYGGRKYDPWADYDGDGQSNYAEFLAETNPFDASDVLRIRKFESGAEGHRITFEYVGRHLYGIAATPSLVSPRWSAAKVKSSRSGEEKTAVQPSAANGDIGETTVYVVPAEGGFEKSGFFRLEPK